jgi:hypothetical protein
VWISIRVRAREGIGDVAGRDRRSVQAAVSRYD